MSRPAVRAVVARPSGLLRATTVRLLRDGGIEVPAQAADAGDLLRKLRAHRPDVAVVDARCAGDLAAVRDAVPGVLVLGAAADRRLAGALLAGGAGGAGYLLEPRVADVQRFLAAVRTVAAGGSVLDPEVIELLLAGKAHARRLAAFGERQREVLAEMAAGASNRAIAGRLFLSERAVERQVTAIFGTLGLPPDRRAHRRVLAVLAYLGAA
jgi:DNA-binding NarL/FixJ family response regulator